MDWRRIFEIRKPPVRNPPAGGVWGVLGKKSAATTKIKRMAFSNFLMDNDYSTGSISIVPTPLSE